MNIRLTRSERRWVWGSSALVLIAILALVFVAMLLQVTTESPFFVILVYLLEVIVALGAGILAGTITGFFKIEIEKSLTKNQRVALQATGGFAVFLIVLWISPRDQVANYTQSVFGTRLAECRSLVFAATPPAETVSTCLQLTKDEPSRHEPHLLLNQFHQRTASLATEKYQLAAHHGELSLNALGITITQNTLNSDNLDVEVDSKSAREAVFFAAVAFADLNFRRYAEEEQSEMETLQKINLPRQLFEVGEQLIDDETSDEYRARVFSGQGLLFAYSYYFGGSGEEQLLIDATEKFELAAELLPGREYLQHYNLFFVHSLRAEASGNQGDQLPARLALSSFIDSFEKVSESSIDAPYLTGMYKWLNGVLNNDREDLFLISRPIGGMRFGGDAMKQIIDANDELRHRLLSLI